MRKFRLRCINAYLVWKLEAHVPNKTMLLKTGAKWRQIFSLIYHLKNGQKYGATRMHDGRYSIKMEEAAIYLFTDEWSS